MHNISNVVRTIIVFVLVFVIYQVVLTPAQRTVVVETIQKAVSSDVPNKTVIQTVPTANVVLPTTITRVIMQQNVIEPTPTNAASITPPDCVVTTDYRDGHQFCSDGRGFSDGDPRKQPGYCNPVEVDGGWWECTNGARMDAIVNIPVQNAPPTNTPLPAAVPADYIITNGCVLAVSRTDNQARTVCPPSGTVWTEHSEMAVVAQMIIDGKYDYIVPNGTGSGPKG